MDIYFIIRGSTNICIWPRTFTGTPKNEKSQTKTVFNQKSTSHHVFQNERKRTRRSQKNAKEHKRPPKPGDKRRKISHIRVFLFFCVFCAFVSRLWRAFAVFFHSNSLSVILPGIYDILPSTFSRVYQSVLSNFLIHWYLAECWKQCSCCPWMFNAISELKLALTKW